MNELSKDLHRYDDMLYLPHPEPTEHPRMPQETRAAIFSPFAALSGYDDAVAETARLTDKKIELSETQREELDRRLSILIDRMEGSKDNGMLPSGIIQAGEDAPKVSITYFKVDDKKDGGDYLTIAGVVHKIDMYQRVIIIGNSKQIPIDNVFQINGDFLTPDI